MHNELTSMTYITLRELADILRTHKTNLWQNIRKHPEKYPPYIKPGKLYLFAMSDVKAWLEAQKTDSAV